MDSKRQYKYIVVEDEKLIRRNMMKKLKSLTLPLVFAGEASNGVQAIELIDKVLPSIVITDIQMSGLSGLELAGYVLDNHPKTRVIIISGYNEFNFAVSAIKYRVFDYLLKPVKTETFLITLQRLLVELKTEDDELSASLMNAQSLSQEELADLMAQYIRNNYQSKLSLGDLSDKMGYSSEYLGKIFKKHIGETPIKYILKLRMNEAKFLLLNRPDLEVQKVGEIVGYQDAFYFSRIFKSHVGYYPSDYREKNVRICQ